jgi:hypothetical protein
VIARLGHEMYLCEPACRGAAKRSAYASQLASNTRMIDGG